MKFHIDRKNRQYISIYKINKETTYYPVNNFFTKQINLSNFALKKRIPTSFLKKNIDYTIFTVKMKKRAIKR